MGLREVKSARARQRMVGVAIDLFLEQGYDETTMEQIAERAEVGTTTLYRYFPTKDLLLLDRIVGGPDLGQRLRDRSADEPVGTALAAVLRAAAIDFDAPDLRIAEIRQLVDATPVPRARLWDFRLRTRSRLQDALAERMGRAATDLSVRLTAAFTLEILALADDHRRTRAYETSVSTALEEVLAELADTELVLPSDTEPDAETTPRPPGDRAPE